MNFYNHIHAWRIIGKTAKCVVIGCRASEKLEYIHGSLARCGKCRREITVDITDPRQTFDIVCQNCISEKLSPDQEIFIRESTEYKVATENVESVLGLKSLTKQSIELEKRRKQLEDLRAKIKTEIKELRELRKDLPSGMFPKSRPLTSEELADKITQLVKGDKIGL